MVNWYVNYGDGATTGYFAVAKWQANHAYTVGAIVRQNAAPGEGNERCFRCTTAGTSGATEPAWSLAHNSTTVDNSVHWAEITGQEAYQSPGNWAAPHARVDNVSYTSDNTGGYVTVGDNIYVASANAEVRTNANLLYLIQPDDGPTAGVNVICVDETGTGHVPPTSADFKTGASITSSGADLRVYGSVYWRGITLQAGSGTDTQPLTLSEDFGNTPVYKNCTLKLGGNGHELRVVGADGDSRGVTHVLLDNTTIQFADTGHSITSGGPVTRFVWKNTPNAIAGATLPTNLFALMGPEVLVTGVDLSALGAGKYLVSGSAGSTACHYVFNDCKIGASVGIVNGTPDLGVIVDLARCDSGATNNRTERYGPYGTQTTETKVIRTGGASDGTTGLSWKIATNGSALWQTPFEAICIAINNVTLNTNRTITLCGLVNAAALPKNDETWFDVEYLGSASSPLGSFGIGTKGDPISSGTSLTADTSAWDSQLAARANGHAYVVGDTIKLASNPGRVFFCTTAGTSAVSEPAGYASAVDGGSVTDGGATFRAGVRFKLTVTLSSPQPAQSGYMFAAIKAAKASATYWWDPLITLG